MIRQSNLGYFSLVTTMSVRIQGKSNSQQKELNNINYLTQNGKNNSRRRGGVT